MLAANSSLTRSPMRNRVPQTPSGMPGMQTLVTLMLDHVHAGRIAVAGEPPVAVLPGGADPTLPNRFGITPLMAATVGGGEKALLQTRGMEWFCLSC